jgi:hypothetical protein
VVGLVLSREAGGARKSSASGRPASVLAVGRGEEDRDEGPGDVGDKARRDRRDRPGDRGDLRDQGLDPTVLEPEQVDTVDGYDAVVLGSAVDAGHWLRPARDLVCCCGPALADLPVSLFSSGPVGDPPMPEEDPVDVAEVLAAIGAREHRLFAGRRSPAGRSASPPRCGPPQARQAAHDARAG